LKIGDLIKFESSDPLDRRCIGTVLRLDDYTWETKVELLKRTEPIIQVLWNTSQIDWILSDRVEVINEGR
jgi:hypothetical protein